MIKNEERKMKKKFVVAALAAVLVMGGCGKEAAPSQDSQLFEETGDAPQEEADSSETGDKAEHEDNTETETNTETEETSDEYAAYAEDYTETIKSEIAEITTGSGSLTDELASVNELYDKYDELRMNAPDQTAMNIVCQWGTVVWQEEVKSLLERIEESDPENYKDILTEYENWESYVPDMADKMSYEYVDGSIYPTIHSYNTAMRYKNEAYGLASVLSEFTGEVTFTIPESSYVGYYGDYAGNNYLIINEGMESGSYSILVHFDDSKELMGWGSTYEYPDGTEVILFNSDDETVKATIETSALGADFYVSETDGSVVEPEMVYSFTFKY